MTKIPFLDVRSSYQELKHEIDEAVDRVLTSGNYILGPEVESFEEKFAEYVGARFCVGVGNGLDALHLALMAMGVSAGDEVIVPSNTFIATWLAVSMTGATVVPVEPDPLTLNICPAAIAAAISPRTKVILPVHLYGRPANIEAIQTVAAQAGVSVLEDAAQAHGASIDGKRIGAHGGTAAWSFYPGKNLGAFGDGGAVTTDDDGLAKSVRLLRNYGSREKYVNDRAGVNSRLDPLQAAVLSVKLARLDDWNARRHRIATYYSSHIDRDVYVLPSVPTAGTSAWHLYVVRHPQRDAVINHLRSRNVEALIHYPIPPHLQGAYARSGFQRGSFPISERIHAEVFSLPIGPHLSINQAAHVVEALNSYR